MTDDTTTHTAPIVPSSAELADMAIASADPAYVLVLGDVDDNLVAASIMAQAAAKRLGVHVCVADARTLATVKRFDPPTRGGGKRGDSADKPAATPRGADWSSKSGQIVSLMLRPEGATMDEMKELTGWSFGANYAGQLARSFAVVITVHEANARTKRIWHAEHASDAAEPVPEDVDAPNTDSNVIDWQAAAELLAAD